MMKIYTNSTVFVCEKLGVYLLALKPNFGAIWECGLMRMDPNITHTRTDALQGADEHKQTRNTQYTNKYLYYI